MLVAEFFSGSGILSETFEEKGHKAFTSDIEKEYNPDLVKNILYVSKEDIPFIPDVMWFSVPCTKFSVASIGSSWTGGKGKYISKTEETQKALDILDKSIKLISEVKPKIWFIENPRGVMRKVIEPIFKKYGITEFHRHTITYCQYGEERMKPTDIFSNRQFEFRPMCKNGDSCHVSAPRGSKTGTQGLKNAYERSKLPKQLCEEIVNMCSGFSLSQNNKKEARLSSQH